MGKPRPEGEERKQEAEAGEPGPSSPPVRPPELRPARAPGDSHPPTRRLKRPPINLPAQPRRLIDRETERAAAGEQLIRPDVRLLTITGPPGVGKTHFALAVASDMAPHFSNGVAFVDLSPIREPNLVADAIAQALKIREVPEFPLLESLKAALHRWRLLLVLDNFEQLLPAATVLAELLTSCHGVKALVTSRAALQVRWERLLPLPPLELPGLGRSYSSTELLSYPAVTLFVEHARAVRPTFKLTPHNAIAVAEICTRLDGLPLAIELAAAHSYALLPDAILERLDRRLDLPAGGPRDLPARHQTLRGALNWSYDLLSPDERRLFRCLGVFADGCTLEAVEVVCGLQQATAVEGLISLVAKSLIRQEEQQDEQARFRMLETVRDYALERLQASEDGAEPVRRRHVEYFLRLVETAEPELWGAGQVEWSARLDAELDNLREAMAWSTGLAGDAGVALRFAGALSHFWDLRGHLSEGRRWMTSLLEASPSRTVERVKALNALAFLAMLQGDTEGMRAPLQESHAVSRGLGERSLRGFSLMGLGFHALMTGDDDRAAPLLEEGLALARETGDGITAGMSLFGLAIVLWARGDQEGAIALQQESLALARGRGDGWRGAHSLFLLGRWMSEMGDPARGEALLRESLTLRLGLEDKRGAAACIGELAFAAAQTGLWDRAARLLGVAEALRASVGGAARLSWQRDPSVVGSEARASLGEKRFEAAFAWGRTLGMEEAAAYALGAPEPDRAPKAEGQPGEWGPIVLTRRERQVAALLAQGLSSAEIADRLFISVRTAENHVNSILRKLRLSSRIDVARWAAHHGLVKDEAGNRAPDRKTGQTVPNATRRAPVNGEIDK